MVFPSTLSANTRLFRHHPRVLGGVAGRLFIRRDPESGDGQENRSQLRANARNELSFSIVKTLLTEYLDLKHTISKND